MRIKNAVILLSGLALILSLSACKQPEEKTTGNNAQKAQVEVPSAPASEKPVQEEPIQVQEPDKTLTAEPAEEAALPAPAAEEPPPVPAADDNAQGQPEPPQLQPAPAEQVPPPPPAAAPPQIQAPDQQQPPPPAQEPPAAPAAQPEPPSNAGAAKTN